MSTVKRHWPLVFGVGVYWALVMLLVNSSVTMNQGRLVYPLDDTYIHMAVARNVVAHHVWGTTRYEFTSSTSSPLWTLLLAGAYLLFGVNDWWPLTLDVIFGTLTVFVSYRLLGKYIASRSRVFVILLVAILATPLPTLTVIGMEHVLHALLSVLFLSMGVAMLSADGKAAPKRFAALAVLAALVVGARYEGIFLVLVVCVLFLLQRKVLQVLALGVSAVLPVSIYGAWCVSQGWYLLPNSVLLKGHLPQFSLAGFISLPGFGALSALQGTPHLLVLLTFSLFFVLCHYLSGASAWDEIRRANLIFIGCLLLHMQFAATGWLYRYEAYLVLIGVLVIGITVNNLLPARIEWRATREALPLYGTAILLMLLAGTSLAQRMFASLVITPQASRNIYEQQYQMGRFLQRYYPGRAVAVNDIGAVSYLADVRLLDLWGLANVDVARLKLRGEFGSRAIDEVTRKQGAVIAILYEDWFKIKGVNGLPLEWIKAGQWSIPGNVACGSDTVSLYGLDPSTGEELAENLRRFEGELPDDVAQAGVYVERR